mgnify:CR=1 FL=1
MEKGYVSELMKFYVRESAPNQRVDYDGELLQLDCYWFEKAEGDKKGLEFIVPIEHPEYKEQTEKKLQSLEPGDVIVARFESMNQKGTVWICNKIDKIKQN